MDGLARNLSGPELSREDLAELLAVVRELSALRTIEEVAAVVRRAARKLSDADGVTFVLREGDNVFYADEDAIGPLWKGRRFPANSCISGLAIANRQAVVIPDVFADPRVPHELYRATFVKSLVMTPIRRVDPLGAIGAYWATPHTATAREQELLQALADSAAVAVDNARLYSTEQSARTTTELISSRREEFIRWLSHDLRNPLSAIIMSSALLAPMLEPLNGRARGHISTIRRSAQRMEKLIHDLLDIAALEGAVLKLQPTRATVEELLNTAQDLVPVAHEHAQQLDITYPHEPLPDLHCDVERVAQIISNLVGNAIHHTPAGGRITVSARRQDGAIWFDVQDTGPGIPSEVMATLFEPGRRTERAVTSGLGLGLVISRGIVERHGGQLTVHSQVGEGSTFSFTLPCFDGP